MKRYWMDVETYDGKSCWAHPVKDSDGEWVRHDDAQSTIARLTAELDEARATAKRMDRARDQFLGERNILAEALSGIHRGDMTNMMEFTEAEAAKIKAGWALNKIGTPAATALAEMLDAETRACAEICDRNDQVGGWVSRDAILARLDQRKEGVL